MKKILYILLGFIMIISISCEELDNGLGELTTEEVVNGLKTALAVGTDSSTIALAAVNGYYGNSLLKIPLPPEAEALRNTINGSSTLSAIFNNSLYSIDDKFEDVIKSINHAASDAAKEAAPIFKESITSLSITDAWDILNGINPAGTKNGSADFDSTAATSYFKSTTSTALTSLYAPKINTSLDKPLVGNLSATNAWTTLTDTYNSVLNSTAGQTAITSAIFLGQIEDDDLPDAINTDLGEFCVGKALDGLFNKVGEEEKNIRRNPLEWIATTVGDILERVFGGG